MNWDFSALQQEFQGILDNANVGADNGTVLPLAGQLADHVGDWLLAMGWDGTVPDSWEERAAQ